MKNGVMVCFAAICKEAKNDQKTTPPKKVPKHSTDPFLCVLQFQASFTKVLNNKHVGTEETKVLPKTCDCV